MPFLIVVCCIGSLENEQTHSYEQPNVVCCIGSLEIEIEHIVF